MAENPRSEGSESQGPAGQMRKRVERRRGGGSRRFAIVVIILVVVALVGAVGARPVWRMVKRQRARNLAEGALRDLEAGRLADAARAVRTASLMAPEELPVLQAVARLSVLSPSVVYLPYWENLLSRREATTQDRVAFVKFTLSLKKYDLAGAQLTKLLAERPADTELLALLVEHHSGRGALQEAAAAGRVLLEKTGSDPVLELKLAYLLLRCPAAGDKAEGRRLLWALAVGTSKVRDQAVHALVDLGQLSRAESELLLRTLSASADRGLDDEIRVLELRHNLAGPPAEALYSEVAGRVKGATNLATAASYLAWLARHKAWQATLEGAPEGNAATNSVMFSARLDALTGLGRLPEAEQMLSRTNHPLTPVVFEMAQAGVAAAAGRSKDAETRLYAAAELSQKSPAQFLSVAQRAEGYGLKAVALELYQRALLNPASTLAAANQLLRLAVEQEDLSLTRKVLRALSDYLPGDDRLAYESAWLDLLFTERVDAAHDALKRVGPRVDPDGLRFALALAELRSGNTTAALALLEGEMAPFASLTPRQQAVYVAVLGANQQREAARRFARQMGPGIAKLRLQERELVSPWQ